MALDSIIRGNTSGTGAEVNASNQLKVVTETNVEANPGNVGAIRIFSENDPGSVTGTPFLLSPETSDDYRLRVGVDSLLYDHTFSETVLDSSAIKISNAVTMTSTLVNGFLTLNAGSATVSGNYISFTTPRHFRVRATSPLYVEITGTLTTAPITNQQIEAGLYLPTAGTRPQDGVWYEVTTAGIKGLIAYNGTFTETAILVTPGNLPINVNGCYLIVVNLNSVEFWIDDILYATLQVPTGNAVPYLTDSLPVTIMQRNIGTVNAANQCQIKIGDIGVTAGDIMSNRSWAAQMSGMGQMGSQTQAGFTTPGSTASLPNATAATTLTGAALSQTVPIKAVATGGLGGEAAITAAVPGLDGMVFSFQNPVGSITQPPRNLTIMGLRISSASVGAAAPATLTTLQWSLAYGATGATVPSLAQTEAVTLTAATARAYRRIPLGLTGFAGAAAIGTVAPDITVKFDAPITLMPGEWLALCAKFIVGAATASHVIWCNGMFDSHWD